MAGSSPKIRSSPPVTGETAATIRMVEDLPAPLGPRKPNASPRRTSTSMPLTASNSPKDLRRSRAEIMDSLTWSNPTNAHRHPDPVIGSGRRRCGSLPPHAAHAGPGADRDPGRGSEQQAAVLTLAARLGRELAGEGVLVAATGGATNIGRHLERLGPRGLDVRVAGLYDVAEERFVRKGLERAGFGTASSQNLEALGFFACTEDLEDELIRALGVDAVLAVIERRGTCPPSGSSGASPRTQTLGDTPEGAARRPAPGGRKVEYAALLVEALDLAALPRPLEDSSCGRLGRVANFGIASPGEQQHIRHVDLADAGHFGGRGDGVDARPGCGWCGGSGRDVRSACGSRRCVGVLVWVAPASRGPVWRGCRLRTVLGCWGRWSRRRPRPRLRGRGAGQGTSHHGVRQIGSRTSMKCPMPSGTTRARESMATSWPVARPREESAQPGLAPRVEARDHHLQLRRPEPAHGHRRGQVRLRRPAVSGRSSRGGRRPGLQEPTSGRSLVAPECRP